MSALLVGESLCVSYGGVRAVIEVDLAVEPGEIAGLIGPNGAGKTSIIDGLSGFAPMTGRAVFAGTELAGMLPHRRAALGMLRTWQSVKLFDDLSVIENLQIHGASSSWRALLRDMVTARASRAPEAERALELLGIAELADRMPPELSHGQRVLIGVARAIAGKPRLVLVDEPAAGLDVRESHELARRLRDIAREGTAILLIDHDMDLVVDVCDKISVLDFGRLIASGPPSDVLREPAVLKAYLGESEDKHATPTPGSPTPTPGSPSHA